MLFSRKYNSINLIRLHENELRQVVKNNKEALEYTSEYEKLKRKRKKDLWIFRMYLAVGIFGLVGAVFSETIPQCIILLVVSVFTIVCGFVIKKQGTEDSLSEQNR